MKIFNMIEAVQKSRVLPANVFDQPLKGLPKLGQCPNCELVSRQLLDSNYCHNCGQRLK